MSDESNKEVSTINYRRYIELIDECTRLDDLFYNEGIQGVPDHVYDAMRRQITLFERTNPSEIDYRSPNLRVGQGVNKTLAKGDIASELVIKHNTPMLSMQNEYSLDGLYKRLGAIFEAYGDSQWVLLEDKLNGVAGRLYYKDGILSSASTRGDGDAGTDITVVMADVVPSSIDALGDCEFTGEIVLRPGVLKAYNDERSLGGFDPCANELSAVNAILRSGAHSRITAFKYINFIAFDVSSSARVFKNAYEDKHDFITNCKIGAIGKIRLNKDTYEPIIRAKIKMQGDSRVSATSKYKYSIDGFVFKVDSSAIRKVIGETKTYPKWCFAYKFEPVSAKAVVCGYSFTVGRTGVVTPVIRIDPTEVLGTLVTKASLANSSKLFKLDVRVGDTVTVYRGGDVIPQIGYVVERPITAGTKIVYPTHCPCCSTELEAVGALIICKNDNCSEKLTARLANLFSVRGLGFYRNGPGMAAKLVANGITNLYELFSISEEKKLSLLDKKNPNHISVISLNVLVSAIKAGGRNGVFLSDLIQSLSITGVGASMSVALHTKLQSFEAFLELENFEVADKLNIINYSHSTAKNISDFIKTNISWLKEIPKVVKINCNTNALSDVVNNTLIKDKLFVFSGEFEESRNTLQSYVTQMGGSFSSSVTKKTDYFVVGKKPSKAKLKSAAKNKTKTIDYSQFKVMMQEIG